MKTLIFSFFLFSCAHSPVQEMNSKKTLGLKLSSPQKDKLDTLETDLKYLKKLNKTENFTKDWWLERLQTKSSELFTGFLAQNTNSIRHDDYACSPGEVACTHPKDPGVIFVTNNFFRLSRYGRLATLIHEAFHWYRPSKHFPCQGKQLKGHTCDDDFFSPYGVEVVFLTQILNSNIPWFTRDYYIILAELEAASNRLQLKD